MINKYENSNRDEFIKKIIQMNDFYYANKDDYKFLADKRIKSGKFTTYREYFETLEHDYPISYVEINRIKQITLRNNLKDNPFIVFYEIDEGILQKIFDLLAKTHRALNYYYAHAEKMRDLKARDTHKNISRKIQDVIDYVRETDEDVKEENSKKNNGTITVEYLYGLKNSLLNNHYTKRQLYQNFLFEMHNILKDKSHNSKKITKAKIYSIVNSIIIRYFDDEESFTLKTNINKFTSQKYIYETMEGITLRHGKK